MGIVRKYSQLRETLIKYKQGHILAYWDELKESQKAELLEQIEKIDFDRLDGWVADYVVGESVMPVPKGLAPAPAFPSYPKDSKLAGKYEQARKLGTKLISEGKVAAFVVAGGQGTRLGFDGPKGNFPISPVKNRTLFELFAETIRSAGAKYGQSFMWYVMTSRMNYEQTLSIFKANKFYGLKREQVFMFEQGTMPSFGLDGRILMADKSHISCSPDGHGGSLKALYASGVIDNMRERGIEYVSYFQIDNPLVSIFDPLFVGLHAMEEAQMSSKAIAKSGPKEKVGNFCTADGKVTVIEYSDLPDELAEKRNPDGSLAFNLGSIAIHMINVDFVEKLNSRGFALPIHRAVKKIPHIDEKGNIVEPSKPNGVKLETFVFDALPLAEKSIILEIDREQEFAPVKNAIGTDSPAVTHKMMIARAAEWLESAGVKVPRKNDGSVDCVIEIAPSFALSREDIIEKKELIRPIAAGEHIYLG